MLSLIHKIKSRPIPALQLHRVAHPHVLKRTKKPVPMSGQPMFPCSPNRAVPEIQPTPQLSVRTSVPSKTGASRLTFGILSTASGVAAQILRKAIAVRLRPLFGPQLKSTPSEPPFLSTLIRTTEVAAVAGVEGLRTSECNARTGDALHSRRSPKR